MVVDLRLCLILYATQFAMEVYNFNKFIDKYGNSEGVGKDDANAGIIIVNTGKKIVDISFSQNLGIDKQKVNKIVEELKNRKYSVKAQFPSTPF